jgi:hypothetical protein
MKRKDIISFVSELMNSDGEDPKKQSQYILDEYNKADKKTREALDNTFIALCGYSLTSIISKPRSYFDFKGGW